jgi:hypothetical protein
VAEVAAAARPAEPCPGDLLDGLPG